MSIDENNVEGAHDQVLEQMLDEERVAVEIQTLYTSYVHAELYQSAM